MKTLTPLAFLLLFQNAGLMAQPGSLDASFGNGGIVITSVSSGTSTDVAYSIAVQPDGKLLVAGQTVVGSSSSFAVARYLPDGNLDPDFGNDGVATTNFGGGFSQATEVLLQADGRIVLSGSVPGIGGGDFGVARFMPDGSLDDSFGTDGKVVTDMSAYDIANAAILQPNGQILVVGSALNAAADIIMARFNADGSLDAGFGSGGKVITNVFQEDQAFDVAVQADGKIVVAGFASQNAIGDFVLIRYLPNGQPDTDFGLNATGIVTLDLQGFNYSDLGRAVAVLPDGNILVVGMANYYNLTQSADIGLVKFDANGLLVNDFGTGGIAIKDIGNKTDVSDIELLPDGTFLLAGKTDVEGNQNRWMLAKCLPNGEFDASFGINGITTTSFTGPNEIALDMALQPDKNIVLVGRTGETTGADFAVARYLGGLGLSVATQNILCPFGNDGLIVAQANGGVAPYEYSLDGVNYSTSGAFSNLPAGDYTIYAKDASGEVSTTEVTLTSPVIPIVDVTIENDQITIDVSGGTSPYMYSINGGTNFQSENVFANIVTQGHAFPIIVLDGNGCEIYNETYIFDAVQEIGKDAIPQIEVSPNPSNGLFILDIKSPIIGHDVKLKVIDFTGKTVYCKDLIINQTGFISLDLSLLSQGGYYLHIGNNDAWAVKKILIAK